jgi:hypothetical protein
MEDLRSEDPERAAARELIDQWLLHLGTQNDYKLREIIDCAMATKPAEKFGKDLPDFEDARPDFRDVLLTYAGDSGSRRGQVSPDRLGRWLKQLRGQVHAGHKLELANPGSTHGSRWMVKSVKKAGERA